MVGLARRAKARTGARHLCLAGGVALNVLANSRVLAEAGFDDVWIQPAAGDSGGAIGAATYVHHSVLRHRERHPMSTAKLGPAFTDDRIADFLKGNEIAYETLRSDEVAPRTASLLARGEVIGWFQGRMEFGPRALGSRSILADPTDPDMKERVNEKIKHREPFRPFAPSVLGSRSGGYFDLAGRGDRSSPFMLFVADVRPDARSRLPAITHVDGTARVQTISASEDALYHDLISSFAELTGMPVLLNTSFNLRGEPIVCTPEDAFNTFSHSGMDHLVMGTALIPASSKKALRPYPGSRSHGRDEIIV
jgi:carbamoyltransferase